MPREYSTDENTTTNKGVNVNSESLPAKVHKSSPTESSSLNLSNRSLAEIKNEIQHVLDMMGPTTPPVQNTSSEADAEDSLATLDEVPRTKKKSFSQSESGRSYTPSSSYRRKERYIKHSSTSSSLINRDDSVMADAGTLSVIDDVEHSCCDHVHFTVSPECLCMYMNENLVPPPPPPLLSKPCEGYYSATEKSTKTNVECKKAGLLDWLKERSSQLLLKKPSNVNPCELYKINIRGGENEECLPKRVVFDLIEGIPKPTSCTVATNTIRKPVEKIQADVQSSCTCKEYKNITNEAITNQDQTPQKNIFFDSDGNTRIDYYYFDHGNAQFFHTTDAPPVMKCEILAEKTERYTTKFWAEFFASIHIGVSFCISFILQLFKFLLYSIIRPLCVGLMQMGSDYFFKPFLTTFFNGLIQPLLIFLYNIATSVRDLCDPIAEAIGYFWRELAVLFRAIRLCTYKKNTNEDSNCDCKIRKCEC